MNKNIVPIHNIKKSLLKATQVSPLKYQGTLLYFFIGGGKVIREGGHFDFFHLDTLLREGCLLVGYFNGEIRVSSFFTKAELRTAIH